jgi:RNA polymerase sigma factor (TIGR02999 family)
MGNETSQICGLLASWQAGDQDALERLFPLIRTELNRLARHHLAREHKNHAMQPSSLVQEAFLRLLPGVDAGWRDRAHFFAAASQVMRHVLVDHARRGGVRNAGPMRFVFP